MLPTYLKLKIGVVSRVISLMESESEESELTVPFPSDSAYDFEAYDPVKTRLLESFWYQTVLGRPENWHCDWVVLVLLLATPTI